MKKLLTIICTVLLIVNSSFTVVISAGNEEKHVLETGSCGNNATYTIYDDYSMVISGTGSIDGFNSDGSTIWGEYTDQILSISIENGITSIGEGTFFGCTLLTSIYIPSSVTSIGTGTFYGCSSLVSINIPDSVDSIESRTFYGCSSLVSINIPNLVISIFDGAFESCSSLTSIDIPSSVTYIGYDVFKGCSSLSSIKVDSNNTVYDSRNNCNAIIERNTDTLLIGCKNTIIPNSVTSIANYAFGGCSSLTSIDIPSSVTSIGDSAFEDCSSLSSITVDSNNTVYDSRNNCNAIIKTNSNELILGCKNTDIPYSVTSIGNSAFQNCSSLTSINIPTSVISIEMFAFDGCSSLISINIPNSVTSIGHCAFQNCSSLTSINIPNSVISIGESAFYGCSSLTSIDIPSSVTSIYNNVFGFCSSLSSIKVDSNNTVYDSRNNCNAIIETNTNTLLIGCKNTDIPNSVTSIDYCAFCYCLSLTSISIPSSVTSIGERAFEGCSSLSSITVDSSNKVFDSRENCNAIIETNTDTLLIGCKNTIIPNSVTSISDYAFEGCSSLTSIDIPNSIKSIGNGAFQNCSSLTLITIPNSVTSMGMMAFFGCSYELTICIEYLSTPVGWNSNWNAIDFDVFANTRYGYTYLDYLLEIGEIKNYISFNGNGSTSGSMEPMLNLDEETTYNLPNNLYKKDEYTFVEWNTKTDGTGASFENKATIKGLSATYGNNITLYAQWRKMSKKDEGKCGEYATYVIYDDNSMFISGSGSTYDYDTEDSRAWDEYAGQIVSITIGDDITSLGNYIFKDCTSLASINIPNSIESIGNSTFQNCSSLTSIYIPSSVTSIGTGTFDGCKNLETIIMSTSIDRIDDFTFANCSSLESVNIPNSVTYIRDCAFQNCSSLISISIPNSVTSIGNYAFEGCSSLTSITIPKLVTQIGHDVFKGCSSLSSITVESGNDRYDSRNNCNAIIETNTDTLLIGCKNTIIPNSVTSIGNDAFKGCSSLTSIIIPDSITSIGRRAFAECSSITSIVIPNSVVDIDYSIFENCSSLLKAYLPYTVNNIETNSSNYSMFYNSNENLVIYTDVANDSSIPSGWGEYWNNYSENSKLQVAYNKSLPDFYGRTFDETIESAKDIISNLPTKPYTVPSVNALQSAILIAENIDTNDSKAVNRVYILLNQVISELKEPTATIVITSNPDNSGILSGGGYYAAGETVKLLARAVGGYTFDGWYVGDVKQISDTNYEFVLSSEITGEYNISAKYIANESKPVNVYVGRGKVNYSYVGKSGKMINNTTNFKVPKGTELSLTAVPSADSIFLYWIDVNTSRILTEELTYTFGVREKSDLMACYRIHEDEYHYVVFKDMNGKILLSADVEDGGTIEAPEHGNFTGYTFTRWDSNFSNITQDMVITALYEKETGYSLTVVNGEAIEQKDSYTYGDKITVKAEQMKDGKYFSGWYVDDQKVSTQLEYTFYILDKNTVIIAKYDGDSPIVDEPIVTLTLKNRIIVSDVEDSLHIIVDRHTPSAYTFNEVGFLLTLVDSKATVNDMIVSSQDSDILHFVSANSTKLNGTYDYTLGLSEVSKTKNVSVRGYLTYIDDSGKPETIYTDIKVSKPIGGE